MVFLIVASNESNHLCAPGTLQQGRYDAAFGAAGVRRLPNPVTLCDGRGVFLVATSGQIRMAANIP
jgi:hypothetical protein